MALVGVIFAATIVSTLATAERDITDLGTLPGHFLSEATGINSGGQVVGVSIDMLAVYHAFRWDDTVGMVELPALPGQPMAQAFRINDAGNAVGQSGPSLYSGHAVLWAGDAAIDLGALPQHGNSSASDINATGSVVGVSFERPADQRAVLWERGGVTDLGILGTSGFSSASALNDVGQIVGVSSVDSGPPHAFLWEGGVMSDLLTLPGDPSSAASDINNFGEVVGTSINSKGEFHAFLWTKAAGMADLGALPGYNQSLAEGINDAGEVVGWSFRGFFDSTPPRASHWSDGTITDLGVLPGGSASYAYGINDEGKIVGGGMASDPFPVPHEVLHAVLWTPTAPPPPVEPLSAAASAEPQRTDVGLNVTFRCAATGGVPPYDVSWAFGDGVGGSGEEAMHAYDTAGEKTATCTVTDYAGTQATSNTVVQVFEVPETAAMVNRTATSPGMPLKFTASATNGTGGYTYVWTFGDASPGATGATVDHAYASPGQYTAEVTANDTAGGKSKKSVTVTVAHLVVTPGSSPASAESGKAVSFTATAVGGAGGYTFRWDFGDHETDVGASVSHVYDRAGSYTPKVTVTDAQGVRKESTLPTITVQTPGTVGTSGPLDIPMTVLIGAVLLIAVVAGVAAYVASRRRRQM